MERVFDIFNGKSTRANRWFVGITLALLVLMVTMRINSGPLHVQQFTHDTFGFLDGGWRILHGQIPHNDFYSALGPLTPFLIAAGLKISDSVDAISYAAILVYLFIVPLFAWIARSRLPIPWFAILCLHVGSCIVATRTLGFGVISYAMVYNRFGEALLLLLFTMLFIPPLGEYGMFRKTLEGFIAGILVALAWFLKLNYFGIALAGIMLSAVLNRKGWHEIIAFLLGGIAVCILFFRGLGVSMHAMIRDMIMMSHAQAPNEKFLQLLMMIYVVLPYLLVAMGVLAALLMSRIPVAGKVKVVAVFIFLQLSALALLSTNFQINDPVLTGLSTIILLDHLRRNLPVTATAPSFTALQRHALVLALGLSAWSLTASMTAADMSSIGFSRLQAFLKWPVPKENQFVCDRLAGFVDDMDDRYTTLVNDGFQLLRRHQVTDARLFVLEFTNPFTFSLKLPPPKGGTPWWHKGKTFGPLAHPSPESVFANVDYVMIPKRSQGHLEDLEPIYKPYITAHYRVLDESPLWTLWKR